MLKCIESFFQISMAVVVIAVPHLCSIVSAEDRPPNIVLMLVDDMGVMDTSVPFLTDQEGRPKRYPLNDFYRTPNMVRLAERGIRFNNFCAMSVCSPTRISIMTGQNAARHRTTNWINPDSNNAGPAGTNAEILEKTIRNAITTTRAAGLRWGSSLRLAWLDRFQRSSLPPAR